MAARICAVTLGGMAHLALEPDSDLDGRLNFGGRVTWTCWTLFAGAFGDLERTEDENSSFAWWHLVDRIMATSTGLNSCAHWQL